MTNKTIKISALKTIQQKDTPVYAFFIPGELITQIADISRVSRDEEDSLDGFQRKAIKQHINNIASYLDETDVLFPNSITLALSPDVKFSATRDKTEEDKLKTSELGTLSLPINDEGKRLAWIVDGQQRSTALSKSAVVGTAGRL